MKIKILKLLIYCNKIKNIKITNLPKIQTQIGN